MPLELLERPQVKEVEQFETKVPDHGRPWYETKPADPKFRPEFVVPKFCPQIYSATIISLDRSGEPIGAHIIKACTQDVAILKAYARASILKSTNAAGINPKVLKPGERAPQKSYLINRPSADGTGIMVLPHREYYQSLVLARYQEVFEYENG